MKQFVVTLITVLFLLDRFVPLLSADDLKTAATPRPTLLVKWKDGPTSEAAVHGNRTLRTTVVRNYSEIGWQLVELPAGTSVLEGMQAFRSLETVLYVEPASVLRPRPTAAVGASSAISPVGTEAEPLAAPGIIPNDLLWELQWNQAIIGAPAAWAQTTGSSNVVVVIIDTGVEYTHEDLAPNMWRNPGETGLDAQGRDKATNLIDDDGNGYVDDIYGIDAISGDSDPMDEGFVVAGAPVPNYHGTLCAGVIGAVGNNGKGVAGINWNVSIMAIRALWHDLDRDFNQARYNAQLLEAFDYVLKMKRRGVNIRATCNSYGNATYSEAFRDALDAAGREGILNVFAAGNNGLNNDQLTFYPASYNSPGILSVAASTETDELWVASNFGKSTVHIAAPGLGIASTRRPSRYSVGFDGTSAACPHVAGAIALLAGAFPGASGDTLKAALLGSADPAGALRDRVMSHGRLNVAKALARLADAAAPPIVVSAQPSGARTRDEAFQAIFSKPMDPLSVESAFTILPSAKGRFDWSSDFRQFTFIPDAPFARTNHAVTIAATARDASGRTLDGNFDGVAGTGSADDFVWTFGFPLANDDFADALVLAGTSGSTTGTTRNASPEGGEPDHVRNPLSATSVWFRWTAPADAPFTFEIAEADFDTLLAVYTGSEIAALQEVASSDDAAGTTRSRVSFSAQRGTIYSIAVAGKSLFRDKYFLGTSSFGDFRLAWQADVPVAAIEAFSPPQGAPGTKVLLHGPYLEHAEAVWFGDTRASFAVEGPAQERRLAATVPAAATDGLIRVATPQGGAVSLAPFVVLPPALQIDADAPDSITLRWNSTAPLIVLESSLSISHPAWVPVPGELERTEEETRLILAPNDANRFYRLHKASSAVSLKTEKESATQ